MIKRADVDNLITEAIFPSLISVFSFHAPRFPCNITCLGSFSGATLVFYQQHELIGWPSSIYQWIITIKDTSSGLAMSMSNSLSPLTSFLIKWIELIPYKWDIGIIINLIVLWKSCYVILSPIIRMKIKGFFLFSVNLTSTSFSSSFLQRYYHIRYRGLLY